MIDHASVSVSDYQEGKMFYEKLLKPLGYVPAMDLPEYKACGFGVGESRDFWIAQAEDRKVAPAHIAFVAKSEDEVKAFHEAGLASGGKDNGAPGPRPDYGPHYYAAFIHDADGNNIEAVYRG